MRWAIAAWVAAGCASGQAEVGDAPSGGDPTNPGGGDDDDNGGGDTTEPGACRSWLATYDLTGSHFYIQSTVDFTITVQEPYSDDLNTGPGRIVLRFPDNGGQPGPGTIQWVEYQLTWDFVTGVAGFADVHTQIENLAGPEACGLATAELSGARAAWSPASIDVCQDGQISCTGPFCGTSGSPAEGEPETVKGCEPWAIHDFTFAPDFQSFDMAPAIVSSDADVETAMEFHAELVEAVEDPAPPACACGG